MKTKPHIIQNAQLPTHYKIIEWICCLLFLLTLYFDSIFSIVSCLLFALMFLFLALFVKKDAIFSLNYLFVRQTIIGVCFFATGVCFIVCLAPHISLFSVFPFLEELDLDKTITAASLVFAAASLAVSVIDNCSTLTMRTALKEVDNEN